MLKMEQFEKRTLLPMLFYESAPFDSNEFIYELKFDGIRCFAYLDNNRTTLINKRGKDVSQTYPELLLIHQNIKKSCLLDGELVIMINGKPNFYELQRRSLLLNSFKIKLAANKYPLIFVVFDILIIGDDLIIDKPLMERKKILQENIIESPQLVISRFIEANGKAFFELAKAHDLEGIVAKEKFSRYYPGKRSRSWLKIKVYQEDDLIICGYVPSQLGIKKLILGTYNQNKDLVYVTTVLTSKDKKNIMEFARKHPGPPLFNSNDEIIWMQPHLVGIVRYMMKTKAKGLRQPVFIGLRLDKVAKDLKN